MASGILRFGVEMRAAGRLAVRGCSVRRPPAVFRAPAGGCQPMTPGSVDSIVDTLGGWLLPPRCVLCGRAGQRPSLDLCSDCEAGLPGTSRPLLVAAPEPLDRALRPFRLRLSGRSPRAPLKYRGQLAAGRVLGHAACGRSQAPSACTSTWTVSCRCRCIRSAMPTAASTRRRRSRAGPAARSGDPCSRACCAGGAIPAAGGLAGRGAHGKPPGRVRRGRVCAWPAGRRRGRRVDDGQHARRRGVGAARGGRGDRRCLVHRAGRRTGAVTLSSRTEGWTSHDERPGSNVGTRWPRSANS